MKPESIHEMRRRAPLHYLAKANNARFSAFVLSQGLSDDDLERLKHGCGYGRTPRIAISEAFHREAALSIELILKAVIGKKVELGISAKSVTKVKLVHDVPLLWKDAGLPELCPEDRRRLLRIKSLLYWSSRYAAPKTDRDIEKENEEDQALKPTRDGGRLEIEKPLTFGWDDFDRIYGVAWGEFLKISKQ